MSNRIRLGTRDTVLVCNACGAEVRYNYSKAPDDFTDDRKKADYVRFVKWAIEDFASEHECEESDE